MAELIIVFREVLEASLIVGILYTYLNKIDQAGAIIRLWQGVLVALAASIMGSLLFQKVAGGFQGQAEKLFEGIVMIVASIVLTTMIKQRMILTQSWNADRDLNRSEKTMFQFLLGQ